MTETVEHKCVCGEVMECYWHCGKPEHYQCENVDCIFAFHRIEPRDIDAFNHLNARLAFADAARPICVRVAALGIADLLADKRDKPTVELLEQRLQEYSREMNDLLATFPKPDKAESGENDGT